MGFKTADMPPVDPANFESNEFTIAAVRKRCRFEPGECVIVWVESQPIHRRTQEYKVIDAALGVVERGTWFVRDAVSAQPWLPDGPIPHVVTWRRPGYEPAGPYPHPSPTSEPSTGEPRGTVVGTRDDKVVL